MEKQFSKTAWEPLTLLIRERGIEAQLLRALIITGPRRSLILQKFGLVLLEDGWQRDSHARHQKIQKTQNHQNKRKASRQQAHFTNI